MENKINLPNHESAPSYSKSVQTPSSSHFYSALTHPSFLTRRKDDIFEKLRSGKLGHLPTHIDPNIQFSDDDDEEETEGNDKSRNEYPDVNKTPEMLQHPLELFEAKSRKKLMSEGRKTIASTPFKCAPRQPLSAYKLPNARSHMNIQNMLPQSENRIIRSTKILPTEQKGLRMNLMSQPDFKMPFERVQSISIPNKSLQTLTEHSIEVNDKSYSVLSLLGSGGSCKVYSVYDPEKKALVAIKCVDLKNTDPSIREGYKKEIEYLLKMQSSNRVIKMYDFEYRQEELFLVLERGDIDFAKYISNEAKLKRLTPLMIKFYWAQMLEAVADIHKYGIIHSDLKPANFLLVAGNLKLIDFGIAAIVPEDKTSTFRDTQVGTLNYMSPEAITQMSTPGTKAVFKVGVKSDVWSLGCILYNLVYGITPFHNLKNFMQKIHAIMDPNYEIVFKSIPDKQLMDVLKLCLKRNPKERASVDQLLRHPYLIDKVPSPAEPSNSNRELKNVMEQMQVLTPRRMSYVSKMVQELSSNKAN